MISPEATIHRDGYEIDVVPKRRIPAARTTGLEKGYWEAVVRRAQLLEPSEALRIRMGLRGSSVRSALQCAAARLGQRMAQTQRGEFLYCWRMGTRQPWRAIPPRAPIHCDVCGTLLHRPRTGGSRQYRCPRANGKASACQHIARMARKLGCTLDEAKARSPRWQRERGKEAKAA